MELFVSNMKLHINIYLYRKYTNIKIYIYIYLFIFTYYSYICFQNFCTCCTMFCGCQTVTAASFLCCGSEAPRKEPHFEHFEMAMDEKNKAIWISALDFRNFPGKVKL